MEVSLCALRPGTGTQLPPGLSAVTASGGDSSWPLGDTQEARGMVAPTGVFLVSVSSGNSPFA